MSTHPQPKKSLFEKIVLWAGGIVTLLTLIFLVLPNLRPKPRPDVNAEITTIEIEQDVTYETYLSRNHLSVPASFTCNELKSNGILIKPAFKLTGLQGETLQIKWSMYGAKSKRLVPSELYAKQLLVSIPEYMPAEQSDIRIFEYWLPYPQIEGELYVHLELLIKDKNDFRPLVYKDTEPFIVTVLPECTGPISLPAETPTMSILPESVVATSVPQIFPTVVVSIPSYTPTPIPASQILLQEGFLNNSNDWPVVTPQPVGAKHESRILGSRYLHTVECPSYSTSYCSYYFDLPLHYVMNFGIYFDATIEQLIGSPNTDVIIGVQFRKSLIYHNENAYYAAYFRSSGAYVLGMVYDGSIGTLKEDQMGAIYNSQIGSTNRFGIEADHALFSLYVNGQKLTTVEDGNIEWDGYVKFVISVSSGGKAVISFDNVLVREIK